MEFFSKLERVVEALCECCVYITSDVGVGSEAIADERHLFSKHGADGRIWVSGR